MRDNTETNAAVISARQPRMSRVQLIAVTVILPFRMQTNERRRQHLLNGLGTIEPVDFVDPYLYRFDAVIISSSVPFTP